MIYLCDCRDSRGNLDLRKALDGKGKMQPTKVNDEGECVYCGNHAPAFRNIPNAESGKRKNWTIEWILASYYGVNAQQAIKDRVGYYNSNPVHGEAHSLSYDSGYANHQIESSADWNDLEYNSWGHDK